MCIRSHRHLCSVMLVALATTLAGCSAEKTASKGTGASVRYIASVTSRTPESEDFFGAGGLCFLDAGRLAIGAQFGETKGCVGCIYIVNGQGKVLSVLRNLDGTNTFSFGQSFARYDANTVAIALGFGRREGGKVVTVTTQGQSRIVYRNPDPDAWDDPLGIPLTVLSDKTVVVAKTTLKPEDRNDPAAPSAYLGNAQHGITAVITNPPFPSCGGAPLTALSGDVFALCAPREKLPGSAQGAVYLFNSRGVLLRRVANPDQRNGFFGISVQALTSNRFAVGACGKGAETYCVYLFTTDGQLQRRIEPPARMHCQGEFGILLAADTRHGFLAVASFGSIQSNGPPQEVYIYDRNGNMLGTVENPVKVANEQRVFPWRIAMSEDGLLAVSSYLAPKGGLMNHGRVDLFKIEVGGKP